MNTESNTHPDRVELILSQPKVGAVYYDTYMIVHENNRHRQNNDDIENNRG